MAVALAEIDDWGGVGLRPRSRYRDASFTSPIPIRRFKKRHMAAAPCGCAEEAALPRGIDDFRASSMRRRAPSLCLVPRIAGYVVGCQLCWRALARDLSA